MKENKIVITVKEIAKICGVSPSTVSNILNGKPNVGKETRKKVLATIQETGYHTNYFASSMRKQNSRMISIIVEDLCQFTTPTIVEEIMSYCESVGYRTILMNMRLYDRWQDTWYTDENKLRKVLEPLLLEIESIKVDGNIYVAGHGREIRCFPKNYEIPTVIAYAKSEKDRFPSVLIDDENGAYEMGRYFVSKGHSRICVIAGVEDNMHTQKRLAGYQKALFEAGIPYNPEWILHGDWKYEKGYSLARQAVAMNPTLIWCMNDQMAGGVYRYLYEQGIQIGKEVSVAGYDNMESSDYMYPRLMTSALPLRQIGRKSAETVIHMIEQEGWRPETMKTWMPCTMTEGQSVADLKKQIV